MDNTEKLGRILQVFEEINAIPRCSKKEEKLALHLARWAEGRGFSADRDRAGNLVVRVPAAAGNENAPMVVFQGHMDMVCEKRPDSPHDFSTDPIRMKREGDWLKAEGTTLGADNGIALALALALAEDATIVRPPLELLFTVDEETGLTGANALSEGFVTGRILLNVDSEDEGVFTVGCAGGVETLLRLPVAAREPVSAETVLRLEAGGMSGGHSGVDIHRQRANALRILARALDGLRKRFDLRIADIQGGGAHNAIPREASVRICCDATHQAEMERLVQEMETSLRAEFAETDPSLFLRLSMAPEKKASALNADDSDRILRLLLALPDGVQAMSKKMAGLVETSCNLARVGIEGDTLEIVTSQRSSVMTRLEEITRRVESTAALAGGTCERMNSYPAWEPNPGSSLLDRCKGVYRNLYGTDPKVKAIHAGLECAVIGAKFPGMDMISFGPDIRDPHCPDEALHIPSVGKIWEFLVALMASFTQR